MDTPNFTANEFVDAIGLNTAFATVSGNVALYGGGLAFPGLIHPEAVTLASTGLVAGVTMPLPFGILFGNGVASVAHGTVTNSDTQSYTVDFSGVVPASGSVTAYLLASSVDIQQDPVQIIGPQAGHPDYNPSFVPYTAYQKNVGSLALSASTTPPDNYSTFELFRVTLAAAASGLGALNTVYQQRTSALNTMQTVVVSGTTTIASGYVGKNIRVTAPATLNLSAFSGYAGTFFNFSAASSGVVIQCNGADVIYGSPTMPSSGVGTINVENGVSIGLLVENGVGQIVQSSPYGVTADVVTYTSGFAPLLNPAFSGTVTVPTVAVSTNNTQAANTEAVSAAVSGLAPKLNPTLSGTVTIPTVASSSDNSTKAASTAFVQAVASNTLASALVYGVKGNVHFSISGGVISTIDSLNLVSVSRTATGTYAITFTNSYSNRGAHATPIASSGGVLIAMPQGGFSGGFSQTVTVRSPANTLTDPDALIVTVI